MNKKAISQLQAILIVAIIAIPSIAGVWYYTTLPGEEPTPTPTASPSPTASPTASPSPTAIPTPTSSVTGADIPGASSLQYTVTVTEDGVSQGSYTYYGKNTGTANFMMRMELTDDVGDLSIFVLNGAERKAWAYSDGEWIDLSVGYDSQFDIYNTMWQGYADSLVGWSGIGDWNYSVGNSGIRISGVLVNPVLPDSLFQPSL